MYIAQREEIKKILRKLEALYPEGKIFALSSLDDDLREQLNSTYLRYGYADLGALLKELGYEIISASAARDLRSDVIYAPGCEPEPIRTKIINMRWLLKQYYPDGVICDSLQANHKSLYSTASGLCMWLGYPDIASMLEAYGYRYEGGTAGRPENDYQRIIDQLLQKYANGPKPKNMGALIFENPDLRSQLKTLQNKAPELFGMSLKAFLTDLGLFEEKAERQAAAAPSGTSKQDAALAALRTYYDRPDVSGSYDDALRALHGLTVKQNRAGQIYIFRAISCPEHLTIPDGIDFISAGAFRNETNLRSVSLPASVTELTADTFAGCTNLAHVTFSEGLQSIGDRAFSGCTALQRMDLPNSLQVLGKAAFSGCTALADVRIPCITARVADDTFENCPYQYQAFSDTDCTDPALFIWDSGKKGTVTLSGYTGRESAIRIPSIVDGAVVTTIATGAFQGNQVLQSVVLPDSITVLQKDAFRDCASLETVRLSNNIAKITSTTFSGCTALRQINIPDSVTELKHNTFRDSPIRVLHIGKGLRSLPTDTFLHYSYHPNAVDMNWYMCERIMERIVVDPENTWLWSSDDLLFSADRKTLLAVLHDHRSFTVPDGVEVIGESAFANMSQLHDISFPESLRLIESNAFHQTGLHSIHIPAGVRQIGNGAFGSCSNLSSVLFEEGVEEIEDGAFDDCPIVSVLLPTTVRHLGSRCFPCFGSYNDKMLDFRIAEGNPFLRADGSALYRLADGEKVLSVLYNRIYKESVIDDSTPPLSYTVEEGTTHIADDAFAHCCRLDSISLPDGLLAIGSHAFAHTALTSLSLPATVSSIGDGAFTANRDWFGNRVGLRNIYVAADNRHFFTHEGALYARNDDGTCALVTYFGSKNVATLPENTVQIYPEAFYNSDLQAVKLPVGLTRIGESAFKGCTALRRLYMDFRQDGSIHSAAVYLPRVDEDRFFWGTSLRDQYMDCIRSGERGGLFDFAKYDSLFESISSIRDKILVAADRLKTSLKLAPTYADSYRRFLRRHMTSAVDLMIEEDDGDGISLLAGFPEFNLQALDSYIAAANRAGSTSVQVLLMNLKNALVGFDFSSFDL